MYTYRHTLACPHTHAHTNNNNKLNIDKLNETADHLQNCRRNYPSPEAYGGKLIGLVKKNKTTATKKLQLPVGYVCCTACVLILFISVMML